MEWWTKIKRTGEAGGVVVRPEFALGSTAAGAGAPAVLCEMVAPAPLQPRTTHTKVAAQPTTSDSRARWRFMTPSLHSG